MIELSHAVRASGTHDCPSSFDPFGRYCAEVPSDLLDEQGLLLDWLIAMVFDTLEGRVLDLRVVPTADSLLKCVERLKAVASVCCGCASAACCHRD